MRGIASAACEGGSRAVKRHGKRKVALVENRKESIGFAFGLLVGAVVGASVAIILAPQSGERTRQLLRDTAKDMQERASDFAADLKEDYQELVEKGKTFYDERRSHRPAQAEPDSDRPERA